MKKQKFYNKQSSLSHCIHFKNHLSRVKWLHGNVHNFVFSVAPELVILGNSIIDEGDTLNLTCEVIAASPMTNASWGPIADGSKIRF